MAAYNGPRSWRELLDMFGSKRELDRQLIGGRWDSMDAAEHVVILKASRLESGALVGVLWANMTLDEQRRIVEGANRCRRAADALLGAR